MLPVHNQQTNLKEKKQLLLFRRSGVKRGVQISSHLTETPRSCNEQGWRGGPYFSMVTVNNQDVMSCLSSVYCCEVCFDSL